MPWLTGVRHKAPHVCRQPTRFGRKEGSLWQCPKCRYIWRVVAEPGVLGSYKGWKLARTFGKSSTDFKST